VDRWEEFSRSLLFQPPPHAVVRVHFRVSISAEAAVAFDQIVRAVLYPKAIQR
jgi:hypothetical protein